MADVTVQVAKCPAARHAVAGYQICEGGITSTPDKLPDAVLSSVLESNISLEHQVQPGTAE
jgi:hypothetical protein